MEDDNNNIVIWECDVSNITKKQSLWLKRKGRKQGKNMMNFLK